jgi:IS605 OrfB family transposase
MYSNFTRDGISLVSETTNKRRRLSFTPYPKIAEMFATSVAKDPTMFWRDGKLWLSIPFEFNGCMPESTYSVGVDLGMKRFFVTSEGKAFTDKGYLGRRRKIRHLKSKLQSKGTRSARRHLRKVSKKERNMSRNYCHEACNALIKSTKASFVVMEDLSKIKKSTSRSSEGYKRKRHNNALSQVPFYMFKEMLTYKATLAGKQVVSVSPFNTSQCDSRTGLKEGERQGCRFHTVDGVLLDADWNAAVNIARKSKHPLSSSVVPLHGGIEFLSGRALSTAQSPDTKSVSGKPLNL